MAENKKVVYIAGPITGKDKYWEDFEKAEELLSGLGYIPLSPSRLPSNLPNPTAMKICIAMIDAADAVLFLDGWERSKGACLEGAYCNYTDKPMTFLHARDSFTGEINPEEVTRAWLKHNLAEVLKQ